MNYKVSILAELSVAIEKHPELSVGQILHEVLRPKQLGGKNMFDATDAAIYTSIERFISAPADEPMNEEEFTNWKDKH